MTNKYETVLFDLDGTILDTREGVIKSVVYTINKYNLSLCSSAILESFVGPPMQDSFKRIYNFDTKQAQEAAHIFREHYKIENILDAKPYPCILELFHELKQRRYKIAVATNKRYDYALKILNHFGFEGYCDSINGADFENTRSKRDIIHLCIKEMGILDNTKVILIGDSEYDAVGANEAGIDFIGVTYGFGFKTTADVMKYRNVGYANSVEGLRSMFFHTIKTANV
jgi:phosphoglycolate phosphatase